MRIKFVFAIYDCVSETVISEFIANNDNVALKAFKNFLTKENLIIECDNFKLIKLGEFESILSPDDVLKFEKMKRVYMLRSDDFVTKEEN